MKRREFIRNSALATGSVAFMPSLNAMSRNFGSDKVRMAFVGIGNRGGGILKAFMNTGMVHCAAICDTDMGAPHTLENMNAYPDVPRFQDFRKMFDKMSGQIDAVCVGTPDFSHFPICMLAMSLGKHVYVEKPLSRTFQESELMMLAAKKYGVATQMGNQGHSEANYFQFKTWVDEGIIKDVRRLRPI